MIRRQDRMRKFCRKQRRKYPNKRIKICAGYA